MGSPALLKVGFGLLDDLHKLREAHPSLAAICHANPSREVANAYKVATACESWPFDWAVGCPVPCLRALN